MNNSNNNRSAYFLDIDNLCGAPLATEAQVREVILALERQFSIGLLISFSAQRQLKLRHSSNSSGLRFMSKLDGVRMGQICGYWNWPILNGSNRGLIVSSSEAEMAFFNLSRCS